MKEVIIKYNDSRVLEVLKSLAASLNFSISEKQEVRESPPEQKTESKAVDFVNTWAGFLKQTDSDNSKYDYLTEKYK